MRLRLLLLAFLHAGCHTYFDARETGSGVGENQSRIIGGTVDPDDPAVVMVRAQRPGALSFFVCTGTLVSRHVVLTAAHCVLPSRVGADAVFTVYVGTNYRNPDAVLTVKETHYDTAFSEDRLFAGHDIGALVTNMASTVPPLPMNRIGLTSAQLGAPLRLIGYGRDSATDDLGLSVGTKRQATTQITDFSSVLLQYDDPVHNTCQGDSGGPALLMVGGTEVIAGVTSFGDSACSRGSDTRVDVYAASFVDPIILANDPPPDMALPQNGFPTGTVGANCRVNSDCQSGTCALQGSGGFCTASCDPHQSGACPSRMHCGVIDHNHYCLLDSSGCSVSPESGGAGAAAALLLAVLVVIAATFRKKPTVVR